MRIIEPHIHTFSRTTDDYDHMMRAGIEAVIEPAFWLGSDRQYPESFLDYFHHITTFEVERAKKYGIRHFSMIAINPKEANNLKVAHAVIDRMEEYVNRPMVVGIGEIGLDQITDAEEEIFVRQLRYAEERKLPVLIHTPHQNKKVGTERIVKIIEREKVTQERIIIDHNNEETMPIAWRTKCWVGLTIYPITKLSPERAIAIVRQYGIGRLLVNGAADWGHSDPLMIPLTAHKMLQEGFTRDQVDQLVFKNPAAFFSQSKNFALQ